VVFHSVGILELRSTEKKRSFGMDGDVETATQDIVARDANGEPLTIQTFDTDKKVSEIEFSLPNYQKMIVLRDNGDIIVKGSVITNDMELVVAMKEFLQGAKSFEAEVRKGEDEARRMQEEKRKELQDPTVEAQAKDS